VKLLRSLHSGFLSCLRPIVYSRTCHVQLGLSERLIGHRAVRCPIPAVDGCLLTAYGIRHTGASENLLIAALDLFLRLAVVSSSFPSCTHVQLSCCLPSLTPAKSNVPRVHLHSEPPYNAVPLPAWRRYQCSHLQNSNRLISRSAQSQSQPLSTRSPLQAHTHTHTVLTN